MGIRWEKLTDLSQIEVGTCLKIIGKSKTDCYKSIKIKEILVNIEDTEIIINKEKNYYFNFRMYMEGKSWASEIYYNIFKD